MWRSIRSSQRRAATRNWRQIATAPCVKWIEVEGATPAHQPGCSSSSFYFLWSGVVSMLKVCRERINVWRVERGWSGRSAAWDWLRRPGSLTAHLRQLGEVNVEVLYEHCTVVDARASVLGGKRPSVMWARDVVLRVDGRPAVVARSLVDAKDSAGAWQAIKGLQARPLATILYNDPSVHRSSFEYCQLGMGHRLYRLARRIAPAYQVQRLWARRSVFTRDGARLAVAECFLPWLYKCQPCAGQEGIH